MGKDKIPSAALRHLVESCIPMFQPRSMYSQLGSLNIGTTAQSREVTFLSDQLTDGRVFRMLVIMDVYSRECLAVEVDTSITGKRVARVLDRLNEQRGLPKVLGSDNGPEFRSRHMDQWAYARGVKLHFIKPGKPTQNAHIESLNSQIRKRLLNTNWFTSLAAVRYRAEEWRTTYNTIQRHGSLNKQTPETFAPRPGSGRLRLPTPGLGKTKAKHWLD